MPATEIWPKPCIGCVAACLENVEPRFGGEWMAGRDDPMRGEDDGAALLGIAYRTIVARSAYSIRIVIKELGHDVTRRYK